MDVVDKIASAKVDKDDIPVKNIVIKSIKITQYKEESTTQQIRHLPKASHSRPQSDKERL